jgi:hypothetical protein
MDIPILKHNFNLAAKPPSDKPKPKKKTAKNTDVPQYVWDRYFQAWEAWFAKSAMGKDGHKPYKQDKPPVRTANGMQDYIWHFIKWHGGDAERRNSMVMQVDNRYIKSGRSGTGDMSVIINGKHAQLEIKAGKDRKRDSQIKRQKQIRAAGGTYEFIYSIEEFLQWFDNFTAQKTLF